MSLFRRYEARNMPIGGGAGTFNPFERPTMPLASIALDGLLGKPAGGGPDPLDGMGLPTAYRCIGLISNVIASCMLQEVDKKGQATPWDDFQNLISYTPYEMSEIMVVHMAGWGNFFAFPVTAPGRTTKLLDLQPIFPGNVSVFRDSQSGKKMFRVRQGSGGPMTYVSSGESRDYNDDEIFHVPFLGYDGLQGVSPITWAAQTFDTTLGANVLAQRFLSQGQQLGGIIQVRAPLADQGQADAIRDAWQRAHGGAGNAGGVAVLDAETGFTPITINPDNLQLIEGRQWQAQEVARVYGVPLTMLSFNQTGYGNAIDTQQDGFVTYTVRQYTDRIEQRLARWFMPRGKTASYDLDTLMRGTPTERYANYTEAINAGWMTRGEARAAELLPPLAPKYQLDEPVILNTMMGATALQQKPMAEPAPASTPAPEPPENDDNEGDDDSDS